MFRVPQSIHEHWELFRQHPAVYMGSLSMGRLRSFLEGYSLAIDFYKIETIVDPFLIPRAFHDWVDYRLRVVPTTTGWHTRIREQTTNEAEAFELFLRLLDEFRARKPHIVARLTGYHRTETSYRTDESGERVEINRLYPENLSLITYTDDPGFFVDSEESPEFFQHDHTFFREFSEFASRFRVTRDELTIIDADWNFGEASTRIDSHVP